MPTPVKEIVRSWYGHLRYKDVALWKVILVSWGIAFLEYCLQWANGCAGTSRRPSRSSSPPWWWSIFPAEGRALALVVVAVAGCAGPALVFERRGITPARHNHDLAECKKEAFDPHGFALRQADRYDREVLTRCMTRKGYSVRPGE